MTIVFTIIFIFLALVENYLHQKNLKKIPIRILVNGTRGKTTVSRMIASALNENNIKTICRTTGSEVQIIMPDNNIINYKRIYKARITEMLHLFRLCVKNNVSCLVVECMALGEETQEVLSKVLVRPTHVVITNSFVDHIDIIGQTIKETVECLSKSIYPNSEVFCIENAYQKYCEIKNCKFTLVEPNFDNNFTSSINMHPSNIALALSVCESLNLDDDKTLIGFSKVKADIGLLKNIEIATNSLFSPSFSVNDQFCMEQIIIDLKNKHPDKKINVIFNNRKDREYRILSFANVINNYSVDTVFCIGDYPSKVTSYLKKKTKAKIISSNLEDLYNQMLMSKDTVFIGLGNIKGSGEKLIKLFLGGSKC